MSVTTLSTEKQGAEMLAPATIFDDVFRTLAQKMPELLIPLVNEVFHTNYPENQEFEQLRNEHYEKYGKVITDSILRINRHLYHIECQSSRDGNMAIRMVEYDFAIALEHSSALEEGIFELEFPESCVLYVRNHKNMPRSHQAKIRFSNGQEILYEIPVIMAQDYTVSSIFEKRLLLLLPYHILRHEHFLASKGEDQERVCKILEEYALIVQKLDEYTTMREQSGLYLELINMIKKIANHIIQEDNPVKEGIGDVMGGKVLKLLSEELLEKGEITKMTTIVCRRLRMGDSPEVIADLLQEPPQEIERICNIAKDYAPDYDVEKIVEKLLVSSIE